MLEINKIHKIDAFEGSSLLSDKSLDCIVTSPPYWSQRNYNVEGQIGLENTSEDYIDNLISIFAILLKKLKDTGTCFVNLGDTYGGSGAGTNVYADNQKYLETSKNIYFMPNGSARASSLRGTKLNKSLLMIPYRFAIKMQGNGWILRNIINWRKPNQMPASCKDRFTVDFEPIFFFTKKHRGYYFNQQFEPYTAPMNRWGGDELKANGKSDWDEGTGQVTYRRRNMRPNPKGRNMRTTWDINTKPLKEAHFAAYPELLVDRILDAGCPEYGLVLDPFMGSGTTALIAKRTNKDFVGFDINEDYINMANNRLIKIKENVD